MKIQNFSNFYSHYHSLPKDTCCRATIANGYLGTVVYSDTVYMNGVYNGRLGDSHRARIPSTAAIEVKLASGAASQNETFKLDVERGKTKYEIQASKSRKVLVLCAKQRTLPQTGGLVLSESGHLYAVY